MTVKDIIEKLEQIAPGCYAEKWDNPGLLVGRSDREADCVYIALDATETVIEQAIACKAQMIITHHPMIFSPLKQVNDQDFISRRVLTMIENGISYYAMHTNFDVSKMADLCRERLGLKDVVVLDETIAPQTFGNETALGIGCAGNLEQKISLEALAQRVKSVFDIPSVKIFGDLHKEICRVGICPGSGKHMSAAAIAKQCDCLITGDIDHHEGIDANSNGLMIIDAGHHGLEHIFVEFMADYLGSCFDTLRIQYEKNISPFQVI